MKQSLFIFLLLVSIGGYAKSWFVSNITSTADFASLTLAHAQAQSGDTLYVEGGNPYEGLVITKKLVLIGPGYFLTENPDTHFNKMPALIKSTILFEKGSYGSEIMGFDFKMYSADIQLKESAITIKRNRLNDVIFYNNLSINTINDITIIQNYFDGRLTYYGYTELVINRLIVCNNYMDLVQLSNSNITMSALFENNTINSSLNCKNSTIRNNIFISGGWDNPEMFKKTYLNNISNNIFTYNTPIDLVNYSSGTNNQWSVSKSIIFIGVSKNNSDGQWQLTADSPAKGAGYGDADCGMFGGPTPYQLSGLPPVPVVYEIIGPDMPSGKVTIKARAIK
jgi:hypothetical protein